MRYIARWEYNIMQFACVFIFYARAAILQLDDPRTPQLTTRQRLPSRMWSFATMGSRALVSVRAALSCVSVPLSGTYRGRLEDTEFYRRSPARL